MSAPHGVTKILNFDAAENLLRLLVSFESTIYIDAMYHHLFSITCYLFTGEQCYH